MTNRISCLQAHRQTPFSFVTTPSPLLDATPSMRCDETRSCLTLFVIPDNSDGITG